MLPIIPAATICSALADAVSELIASLADDERNVLLTLARMWWTSTKGSFVSKDEAATWAAAQLAAEAQGMLDLARCAYLGKLRDDWDIRQDAVRRTAEILRDRIAECFLQPTSSRIERLNGNRP